MPQTTTASILPEHHNTVILNGSSVTVGGDGVDLICHPIRQVELVISFYVDSIIDEIHFAL